MRKIISILFMMCLFAFGINAYAAQINFTQDVEAGTCTVSGLLEEARSNGYVSIEIIDTNNLDKGAKIISGERISHITYTNTDFSGNFTYTFKLNGDALSGEYTLRIGAINLSKPLTQTIQYVNKSETELMVLRIKNVSTGSGNLADRETAVDEIFKIIDGKLKFLGIDDSSYTKLSTIQKKNIAREILDNRTGITTISEAANRGYLVQLLEIAKESEIDDVLEENKDIYGIENEIMYSEYLKISDKTQFNNIFNSYTVDTVESVEKAFNESVLLYLMDNSLPGKITEMFANTNYRAVIPFDLSTYDRTNKGETSYILAGQSITSMSSLETLIADIYKQQQTAPSRPSQGGGGGGGGSSNSGEFIAGITAPSINTSINTQSGGMFNDLSSFGWAKEAIEGLAQDGIVSGVGNKKFAPERNITREEFVKIIINAFGFSVDSYTECNFMDVDKNSWAYPYIAKASELGIISGISETHFGMGSNITREDMAVIVVRAMDIADRELPNIKDEVTFDDYEKLSDYAKDSVMTLVCAGVINGFEDNTFRPQSAATRAQSAVMLYSVVR